MKRLVAIVMSLTLLVFMAVPASAAARAFLLQEYDVISDEVLCYGKQLPAGGKLEVSVGARIVNDPVISTLEQEKIPVTVFCLVDSATSLSDRTIQQRTDILLNLSSLMAKEDSMVLSTIDAALTESKPMNTKEARDTAVETISGQVWYTNLYDGINQALKTLHTKTSFNTNRCLVILSDGHDDGKSIVKGEEILKQIQETGIPVYTVILSNNNITESEMQLQKQFADESLGGFMSFPDRDNISAATAAQRIWSSIKGAAAIRIKMEELQESGMDQQLLIRYDVSDTRYEDTILVRAVDLQIPKTGLETTEETSTNPVESDDDKDISTELLLACGVGTALLVVGISIFFVIQKKKTEDNDDTWILDDPSDTSNNPEQNIKTAGVTIPVTNRCYVHAVAVMHPNITADFYLTPGVETTFGRTEKADIVLNRNDSKLSGCHGCFFWDGKMLLVQDMKSKNGTAVNGEVCPQNVWLRLEEDAVLTAGMYEYRIKFEISESQE